MQRPRRVPDIDGAALASLPLFPLPDVVLFPGALMPLHIFEARYREMTRDALAGPGLLAMARLRGDSKNQDDLQRPAVYPIAGVGKIEASRQTDDGRYYLVLRGLARIAIREELPGEGSYRRVRAAVVPDVPADRPELVAAYERQLVAMCHRLTEAVPEAEALDEMLREAESAGERADLVAAALVSDPDARQQLLETLDPTERLTELIGLVAEGLAELGVETERN